MSEVSFGDGDDAKELKHVKTLPFRNIQTLLKLAVDIKGSFDTSDSENGPMVSSFILMLIKKHDRAKFFRPGILKSQQITEAFCTVQFTSKLSSRQTP